MITEASCDTEDMSHDLSRINCILKYIQLENSNNISQFYCIFLYKINVALLSISDVIF